MTDSKTSFDNVAASIFATTNSKLCDWETLSFASKKGYVKTNFRFHTNHFKSLIQNPSNKTFFQGLINIKYVVSPIWLCVYLYNTKDFYFLLTLPVCFLFGIIVRRIWFKRLIATILSVTALLVIGKYLNLNSNYYYFSIFVVTITALIHAVYNTFLTELFYATKENFVFGIDEQYISEIYDATTKKMHKGPYFKHHL